MLLTSSNSTELLNCNKKYEMTLTFASALGPTVAVWYAVIYSQHNNQILRRKWKPKDERN